MSQQKAMSRDYTKYNVAGIGEQLNKRKLVLEVIKDWAHKQNPTFVELQNAFPSEIQGSNGLIAQTADVKDAKRFNLDEPINLSDGSQAVVSNQWGKENIINFIEHARKIGYQVSETKKPDGKADALPDWANYVDSHCWELDMHPDDFSTWNKSWGHFICIRLESKDEDNYDIYMWVFLGGDKPVIIATQNEENAETANPWFSNKKGCSMMSDSNSGIYQSEYDIMIFSGLPEKVLEGENTYYYEEDDYFVYSLNVEGSDAEIGVIPHGLSKDKLMEIVSRKCITRIYNIIAFDMGV